MKQLFILIILLVVFFKTNAQGNVKASDIVRVDDNFVSCDNEILASFPGGLGKFNLYLMKSIHYPATAVKSKIHGKMILDFIVEKDGRINAVKVVKSVSPDLDAEAVKVLKNSPKWNPTKNCGKARRTQYRIPINFELPKTKK
jgi:TonB family protein